MVKKKKFIDTEKEKATQDKMWNHLIEDQQLKTFGDVSIYLWPFVICTV